VRRWSNVSIGALPTTKATIIISDQGWLSRRRLRGE
jgi:hypothetical protein